MRKSSPIIENANFGNLPYGNTMQNVPIMLSVDTLEGVNAMISKLSKDNENTLKLFSADIFGDGYKWQNLTPGQLKAEILGFLLDQKELFEASQPVAQPNMTQDNEQLLPSSASSPASNDLNNKPKEELNEENLNDMELQTPQ